jgi:hypothetical protein
MADREDLAAPETVDLALPAVAGACGIVISARQSLLTPFLLYETMAYIGHEAGDGCPPSRGCRRRLHRRR